MKKGLIYGYKHIWVYGYIISQHGYKTDEFILNISNNQGENIKVKMKKINGSNCAIYTY